MKALAFDGSLRVITVPRPQPPPGWCLLRVRLAGICDTDVEITRGYKRFHGILGHEFVADVVAGPGDWTGQRVCGEINIGCGRCSRCTSGMKNHCAERRVLGITGQAGAFAEYTTLPATNLHLVPDSVSDEEAVFVEPLAAAFQILEAVSPSLEERVAVLGDGKLGLLCAQALHSTGARVLLIGKHERKLAIARTRGIPTQHRDDGVPDEVDVVVEATGRPGGITDAVRMVRPRGALVLKTTVASQVTLDLSPIVVKELRVLGSRCGPFERAIAALTTRSIDVLSLVDAVYPLERGVEGMLDAAGPGRLKVLLDPRCPAHDVDSRPG